MPIGGEKHVCVHQYRFLRKLVFVDVRNDVGHERLHHLLPNTSTQEAF